MNTTVRKQTSFRLNEGLIDSLREEARLHNRSLNNYVESILMAFISRKPNNITLAAIKEAESGAELETIDFADFRKFVNNL